MLTLLKRGAAVAAVVLSAYSAAPAQVPPQVQTKAGPLAVTSLAKLEHPWGMAYLPDGRLLITEKPGRLRILSADGKLSEAVPGTPAVAYKGQGGLLDVAVDPKFAENKLVYLSYAEPGEQPEGTKDSPDVRLGANFKADDPQVKGGAVARAKLDGDKLSDLQVIWRQVPKTVGRGHFGGRIVFAPDGTLFITSGERQRFEPAQDPNTNLGAIARINPDGSIPKDNPFANKPGVRPDLYTTGNRNPLGAAVHPATGKLWVNEMGPKGGDELLLIEPGRNFGWPTVGVQAKHYNDAPIPEHATRPEFAPPALAWTPVISPSGMAFYTGDLIPGWKGSALIGGLSSKAVIRVTIEGEKATEAERLDMKARIRDVMQGNDGALLVLTDGAKGELLRLAPAK